MCEGDDMDESYWNFPRHRRGDKMRSLWSMQGKGLCVGSTDTATTISKSKLVTNLADIGSIELFAEIERR